MRSRSVVLAVLLAASLGAGACRRTYVVVPRPAAGYGRIDTLYGRSDGRNVLVTFRHDTTWRVDTVTRLDTLWREGTRIITRRDTVVRRDTVIRRDTVVRRDTVRLTLRETLMPGRVDTVRIITPGGRVDTVRVTRVDTLRLTRVDTVRTAQTDTIRIAGQRTLFVPPGQYPPDGQCRVWVHNVPPGQQARATSCTALGDIPAGAFILYGGEAYDADFDWVVESRRRSVPAIIVAISRQRRRP